MRADSNVHPKEPTQRVDSAVKEALLWTCHASYLPQIGVGEMGPDSLKVMNTGM